MYPKIELISSDKHMDRVQNMTFALVNIFFSKESKSLAYSKGSISKS